MEGRQGQAAVPAAVTAGPDASQAPGRGPQPPGRALRLAFGFAFEDLYRRDGLERLDAAFLDRLGARDAGLRDRLVAARQSPPAAPSEESALLMALAPQLEAFVAELFDLGDEILALRSVHLALAPLVRAKWKFVKRQALLAIRPEDLAGFDPDGARSAIESWLGTPFEELAFARAVLGWQADAAGKTDGGTGTPPEEAERRLEVARRYSAWAVLTEAGQRRHGDGVLFGHPVKTDPTALLLHARRSDETGVVIHTIRPDRIRRRDGFATRRTTASGATTRARIPARRACARSPGPANRCASGATRSARR